MDMNIEMLKDICSGGRPRNQREQARFDAEQWAINEIESLTQELAGAMDDGFNMGSDYFSNQIKALTAERDAWEARCERRVQDIALQTERHAKHVDRISLERDALKSLLKEVAEALEANDAEIKLLNEIVENIGNLHSTTIDEWAKTMGLCDQLGNALEETVAYARERMCGLLVADEALTAWRNSK